MLAPASSAYSDGGRSLTMHTIRLRRPWTKHFVDSDEGAVGEATVQRVDVPEQGPADRNHEVTLRSFRYQRNFNRPTGLSETTKVYLRVTTWEGALVSLRVNEEPCHVQGDSIEVDITDRLGPSNQLELILRDTENQPALLCGEVTLEIDDPN